MRMTPTNARRTIIVGLLVLWEALPRSGAVPALFLPPLSAVLEVGLSDWSEYGRELTATLREIGAALVIGCTLGTLGGALIGGSLRLRALLLPLASALYAVPLVVLYPLCTAWLGLGAESKILFGAIYGFFPSLLATAAGIQTIPNHYLTTARSMGATTLQRLRHVLIPAAIPSVLSGIRLGGALAIVGVVVAEMMASASGIGFLITRYRTMLDSPRVFLGILLVLAITIVFDALMKALERRTVIWRSAG